MIGCAWHPLLRRPLRQWSRPQQWSFIISQQWVSAIHRRTWKIKLESSVEWHWPTFGRLRHSFIEGLDIPTQESLKPGAAFCPGVSYSSMATILVLKFWYYNRLRPQEYSHRRQIWYETDKHVENLPYDPSFFTDDAPNLSNWKFGREAAYRFTRRLGWIRTALSL